MQLQEDLIGDLGGKRLVGIGRFEQMKRRRVIEVVLLENEGLPHLVIRKVPEIL